VPPIVGVFDTTTLFGPTLFFSAGASIEDVFNILGAPPRPIPELDRDV
jgi:hypothetical protein